MRAGISKFGKSKTFTLLLLLAVVIIFFELTSPGHSYLYSVNIKSILDSMVIYILFAIGESLLIISGEIDLSPGHIGVFTGIVMGLLLSAGIPWYIVIPMCVVVGAVFGLLNAFLINALHIQGFIATLATGSFIARGLSLAITNSVPVSIKDPVIVWIGTGKVLDIPVAIIISLVFLIIFGIILTWTKFGRSIYICGGNRTAARFAGLNPKKLSYILFTISGAFGALAGVIYSGRMMVANFTSTSNYAFPAITASILGGVSFGGGSGGMFGCFLGLLILNGFNNGLTIVGVEPYWQSVISGGLLLLALTFDYFSIRNKMRIKPAKVRSELS
jgi:ribose/xylose/arabinose/galactoside ABC-type transport system permease subunit